MLRLGYDMELRMNTGRLELIICVCALFNKDNGVSIAMDQHRGRKVGVYVQLGQHTRSAGRRGDIRLRVTLIMRNGPQTLRDTHLPCYVI